MSDARKLVTALCIVIACFAAIQFVPYGREHAAPPDGAMVRWDSPATEALARRACNDCHSNHTNWPWYSAIAPLSWRIQTHVNEGREAINFTAFTPARERVANAAGEAGETVAKGEMPPNDYILAHPDAQLTSTEKQALVAGLDKTFAAFAKRGEPSDRGNRGNRGESSR